VLFRSGAFNAPNASTIPKGSNPRGIIDVWELPIGKLQIVTPDDRLPPEGRPDRIILRQIVCDPNKGPHYQVGLHKSPTYGA